MTLVPEEMEQQILKKPRGKRLPYQTPAIIHYGKITTRAGSPITLTGDPENSGVDPADLFGNSK